MDDKDLAQAVQDLLGEVSKIKRYEVSTTVDGDLIDRQREILQRKVYELDREYKDRLDGAPAWHLLTFLCNHYHLGVPEGVNLNLYRKVNELEMSVRVANCFAEEGITYVGELVQKNEYDFLERRNFGRKSLREIKELLHDMGLSLGMQLGDFLLHSDYR